MIQLQSKEIMKVRIMRKNQQSTKMIYKNVPLNHQQSDQLEQKINQDNNNETFIILATVFIILLALCLYVYAVVSLNNSPRNSDLHHRFNVSKKLINLRDTSMEDINSQKRIVINSVTNETRTIGAPIKLNLEYVSNFKKLSTQITLSKLNRAKQFLRNFTGPINESLYIQQKQQFQTNYKIFQYEQKPICVVVPTFNNVQQERYKKNIDSILQQQYLNYKVIVIDDASTDNTSGILLEYLMSNPIYQTGKIKIQKNLDRKMAMPNILDASSNFCQPEDIFMILDGDDYLLGKYVFKLFNAAFSSSDSWVVYSNFLTVQGKIGYSRRYPAEIIQKNYFRNVLFVISHLRAFYTKLIQLIKKQDLLDEKGEYFHAANDVAILMPILQMSRQHIKYIPEINYYYNSNTGHNNHAQKKKQQVRNDKYIRMKPKYEKIDQLFTH